MYNKHEEELSEIKKRCETALNEIEENKNSEYPDTIEKKIKKLEDFMYKIFRDANDLSNAVERRVIDLDFMGDTLEDMKTDIGFAMGYLKRLKENLKEESK